MARDDPLIADENFDNRIVAGLQARVPALDLLTVQDLGMDRSSDGAVLAWAADNNRIVLTHDVMGSP